MDISGEVVDVSGGVVDVSGGVVDVSGGVVDVSGGLVDISGGVVDISGGVVDISGGVVDISGGVVDVSGGVVDVSGGQIAIQPTPPAPIYLDDILSSVQVLQQTEAEHRSLLESVGTLPYDYLKPALIQWATTGFRNAYPIHEIRITPPSLCSDGQARSLQDYIQFVSGRTIQEHVATLQSRLPDMVVSFAYTGVSIVIVVSKA